MPAPATQRLVEQIEEMEWRARYPLWSQPLPDGIDPNRSSQRLVEPVSSRSATATRLTVYPARGRFQAPEAVVVHAYLSDDTSYLAPRWLDGVLTDDEARVIASFSFRDDGLDGDPVAGDSIFTARATPPEDGPHSSHYVFRVRAQGPDGGIYEAGQPIDYARLPVRLTGRFRDYVEGGDLIVEAEVEAQVAGTIGLQASLYDRDGRALGWATAEGSVGVGKVYSRLRFYGLLLRDADVAGPLDVRFATVAWKSPEEGSIPGPLIAEAHRTRSYHSADFHDRPFAAPALLAAADDLREELLARERF